LRPRDLGAPREQSRVLCEIAKSHVWRTSLFGEVKTAQSSVKLGWFGLFVLLLGRFPTGSSFQLRCSTVLTVLTTSYHFVPHLSRKSFIVKQKLAG